MKKVIGAVYEGRWFCAGLHWRFAYAAIVSAWAGVAFCAPVGVAVSASDVSSTAAQAKKGAVSAGQKWKAPGMIPCAEIPKGPLSQDQLEKIVPDNSPGHVRVKWATETQEETYGFNILRADKADGEYHQVNSSIIPGEGSTNIPHSYCYEDISVKRGSVYFYQIEEVSNDGLKTIIDGTQATRIKVKTVAEEREWLKLKAAAGSK